MPNEESTCEILLEYIEGITLAQFKYKYLTYASPQYHYFPKESYTEWLEIAKELVSLFLSFSGFDFSDPE